MRGTVTLAAALALPQGFPFRDLILFAAFAVVLGTLVLQGMTLRPIMLRLQLRDDGSVEREVQLARIATLRAGLNTVANSTAEEGEFMRSRYELLLTRAETDPVDAHSDHGDIVRAATAAERRHLLELREDGTIGDAAFQRIEQVLDVEELDLQQLLPSHRRESG
jgi:CPA1 family monovalent cation:H+ antiporter